MKNLLLAAAALAVTATPAYADNKAHHGNRDTQTQQHRQHDRTYHNDRNRSGSRIVLGVGIGVPGYNTYGYQYSYAQTYGAVNPYQYRSRCNYNDTPVRVTGLRNHRGTLYATNGTPYGRLSGERFYPSSTVCVDRSTTSRGYVSFVHDINNNGVFDQRDGFGRAYITPSYQYNGAYGATVPARVDIDYGSFNYRRF